MKLKTVVFYQSVRNWDNNESNTFKADQSQIIELDEHLVKVSKEGRKEVIIVPTANMRYGIADYLEAYPVNNEITLISGKPIPPEPIAESFNAPAIPEGSNESVTPTSSKKKANAKQ